MHRNDFITFNTSLLLSAETTDERDNGTLRLNSGELITWSRNADRGAREWRVSDRMANSVRPIALRASLLPPGGLRPINARELVMPMMNSEHRPSVKTNCGYKKISVTNDQ